MVIICQNVSYNILQQVMYVLYVLHQQVPLLGTIKFWRNRDLLQKKPKASCPKVGFWCTRSRHANQKFTFIK